MSDSQELVSIYQAANSIEANMVKNWLAEVGIESMVSEENEPLAGLPITAPDVLVRRADEERGRAFIADYEERLIAEAEGSSADTDSDTDNGAEGEGDEGGE